MAFHRIAFGASLLAAFGLPSAASAINGTRPRTPPTFYGQACIATVDRAEPFAIDYTIPFPDDELGDDELDDSRTFQFFALSTEVPPLQSLPLWVADEDVSRALAEGIVEEAPPPADVLASSTWAEFTTSITTPQQRLPIRCEDTPQPLQWDLQDVEPGVYQIWAHTFEPPTSLWTRRPGLVRVVDGELSVGPAVSISAPARRTDVFLDSGATIHGCIAADPGTVVTLAWARASELETWTDFATLEPDTETFEVRFMPPQDTVFEALFVRATAVDPRGRAWTSYSTGELVPFASCPDSLDPGPRMLADACRRVPEPTIFDPIVAVACDDPGGMETTGEASSETDDPPADGGGNGGCRVHTSGSPFAALFVLLWARRRARALAICDRGDPRTDS